MSVENENKISPQRPSLCAFLAADVVQRDDICTVHGRGCRRSKSPLTPTQVHNDVGRRARLNSGPQATAHRHAAQGEAPATSDSHSWASGCRSLSPLRPTRTWRRLGKGPQVLLLRTCTAVLGVPGVSFLPACAQVVFCCWEGDVPIVSLTRPGPYPPFAIVGDHYSLRCLHPNCPRRAATPHCERNATDDAAKVD